MHATQLGNSKEKRGWKEKDWEEGKKRIGKREIK